MLQLSTNGTGTSASGGTLSSASKALHDTSNALQ